MEREERERERGKGEGKKEDRNRMSLDVYMKFRKSTSRITMRLCKHDR